MTLHMAHHLAAAFCQNMTKTTSIIRNMTGPLMRRLHYFEERNWLEISIILDNTKFLYCIVHSTEYVASVIIITFLLFQVTLEKATFFECSQTCSQTHYHQSDVATRLLQNNFFSLANFHIANCWTLHWPSLMSKGLLTFIPLTFFFLNLNASPHL